MNRILNNTGGLNVEEIWRRPSLLEFHYRNICFENSCSWDDMQHDIHQAVEAELDAG